MTRFRCRIGTLPLALIILGHLLAGSPAQAQPVEAIARDSQAPSAEEIPHDWGVDVELIQPFIPEVHIFTARLSRNLWGEPGGLRGDLLLGLYLRPNVSHNIVEKINEYTASLGYRQYFWRGLHVDASVFAGWAWGENNKIDGQDYSNPVVLLEANLGYRFGFAEPGGFAHDGTERVGFYVIPQFGFITGLHTDIGPRGGESDFFLQGKLLVGLSF